MKRLLIILATSFMSISCSQSQEEIKRQSLEDVYFYLSTANIIKNINDIHFTSIKKIDKKGNYALSYRIKEKKDSLYLINYYNEEYLYIHFSIKMSLKLESKMDSVNEKNKERRYFPYTKRWKWGVN